jgi:hypothetical protein
MIINTDKMPEQISLRALAHQNHYAAQKIQSTFRGYYCRKVLWRYMIIKYLWISP